MRYTIASVVSLPSARLFARSSSIPPSTRTTSCRVLALFNSQLLATLSTVLSASTFPSPTLPAQTRSSSAPSGRGESRPGPRRDRRRQGLDEFIELGPPFGDSARPSGIGSAVSVFCPIRRWRGRANPLAKSRWAGPTPCMRSATARCLMRDHGFSAACREVAASADCATARRRRKGAQTRQPRHRFPERREASDPRRATGRIS